MPSNINVLIGEDKHRQAYSDAVLVPLRELALLTPFSATCRWFDQKNHINVERLCGCYSCTTDTKLADLHQRHEESLIFSINVSLVHAEISSNELGQQQFTNCRRFTRTQMLEVHLQSSPPKYQLASFVFPSSSIIPHTLTAMENISMNDTAQEISSGNKTTMPSIAIFEGKPSGAKLLLHIKARNRMWPDTNLLLFIRNIHCSPFIRGTHWNFA